jgi:hypothetical protein
MEKYLKEREKKIKQAKSQMSSSFFAAPRHSDLIGSSLNEKRTKSKKCDVVRKDSDRKQT